MLSISSGWLEEILDVDAVRGESSGFDLDGVHVVPLGTELSSLSATRRVGGHDGQRVPRRPHTIALPRPTSAAVRTRPGSVPWYALTGRVRGNTPRSRDVVTASPCKLPRIHL